MPLLLLLLASVLEHETMQLKNVTTVTLFLLLSTFTFGQTGIIKGFIMDKKTDEPLFGADIKLIGTDPLIGTSTKEDGFFILNKLEAGVYEMEVSEFGHQTKTFTIEVKKGRTVNKRWYLQAANVIEEVEVSLERKQQKTQVKMSMVKVTQKEINRIPTIGGESDIATYFETVPGVVSTGDQGGQMYVRGGSPVQNKVLLDGMIIYNPFHSIGFFSVFDTEIIKTADIYTGGFSAEHGGRISSIMDIKTKDGDKKRTSGRISVSPFGAKALLEGPLKKAKEEGDGTISYVLSAKTSYLEQTSKTLYSYVNDTVGLPFNFTDIYGKLSFNSQSGSKFNLFGFNFSDRVSYQGISDLSWNTFGVGSNFLVVPPGSPTLIGGKLSYSQYDIKITENEGTANERKKSSRVDGYNFGFDFKYFIKENELKYGIEVAGFATRFALQNSVGQIINQDQNTTEMSAYIDYKIIAGRWIVNPSFRLQNYISLREVSPEPRLGLKYNASDNLRIKFAGGLYSQNLISANSDRDVVNLFYGFLSGPDDLQDKLLLEDGSSKEINNKKLQRSTHSIVGFEYDVSKKISVNVEGYYKWFNQLTNINRNKIFEDSPDNADRPDVFKKDFIIETGGARGIDLVLKYTEKNLFLWGVYSIGKVDRWDGFIRYAPIFDRRHNINLLGTYIFGEKDDWEVNVRWNFGSGLPFTPRSGYYHNIDFSNGTDTDITTDNSGELSTLFGDLNTSRLPTYHRLDISLKKRFSFSEYNKLEITAGVTNVYSRKNLFYVIPERNEKIFQLPFMPSLAVAWDF